MKKKLIVSGIVLVVVVILFAAIGFLAVPPLLKSQLEKYARNELQRELTIGEIRLNPFDLALEVKDLALKDKDGSPLAGFTRLFVDYEIFPALTRRAFGFREISFTRPTANVLIDKEDSLNFSRLIEDATKNQPKDAAQESKPLPRIIIGKFEIDDAAVSFTDERREKPFATQVDPLDLLLTDFNTLPDQEGTQSIVASTPDGETLKWAGEFGVSPVQSTGTIAVTGLSGPKLWRYAEEMLNFEIPSGTAEFSTAYDFDLKQPEPRLHLSAIRLGLKDWVLKSRNKEDRVLVLKDLQVGSGELDLGKREVVIEKFLLQGGSLGAQRGSDNLINWTELLKLKGAAAAKQTAAAAKAEAPAEEAGPWKIGIKEFRIADFGVAFSDDAAKTPYDAEVKQAQVACTAAIDYAPTGSQVKLDGITVGLSDLSLTPRDAKAPIFSLANVDLGTGKANYKDKLVEFDGLKISKPRAEVWLDKDRALNWAGLAPKAHTASAPQPASEGGKAESPAPAHEQPWRFGIKVIEILDGGVAASDRAMDPPVTVNVEPIQLRLDGVSSDLSKPVAYELAVGVKQGGQFNSQGSLVPATPAAEGTLALKELSLKLGERYVNRFALLVLNSGAVSVAGKYLFALQNNKPTARFNGGFQVAKLDLVEEGTKERFLGWDMMDARGIDFRVEPDKLDIAEIRFDKPGGKFIIYPDRTLNVQRILRASGEKGAAQAGPEPVFEKKTERAAAGSDGAAQVGRDTRTSSMKFGAAPAAAPETSTPSPAGAAGAPLFPVNIQRIRVNKGELFFADLSLTPQFGTRIHDLEGTVNSLSTRRGAKAQMKLEGAIDEYGLARFQGDLSPFAPTDYMNVTATFRNVELTSMTPYSAKFAGYRIASGKLDADLEYFIQQRQLKGENKIVIDQLTLGERVESPDAVKLPLALAIALLKDSDGKIDLGLPVSGSLDDPKFSIGAIVWKVLVNVLTKIVTSPFRALGALFGMDSDKLESVSFDLGSEQLLPPEKEKLTHIAAALEKRPQLKIGIRPVYASEDADAIKSLRVRRELAKRAGFKLQDGEDPGPLDASDPKNQKVIEQVFVERLGKDELAKVTEALEKAQAGDGKELTREMRNEARAKVPVALFAKLLEAETVSEDELKALAQARGDAMKREFEAQGKLPAEKLTVEPVEKVEAVDKKTVPSKFALKAQ